MAKTTRVHLLAKKLGVKSKAIVEKCQAEGLDVKNHMSAISAGLAATISEWFSEGEHTTVVEKAEKVDLEKVRLEEAVNAEKEAESAKAEGESESGVEAAESQAEQKTEATEQADAKKTPPKPEGPKIPVLKKPEKIQFAKPEFVNHDLPGDVKPAGPMLKVAPAKLNGPKVIRVEKVERPTRAKPKPRPRTRPAFERPAAQPISEIMPDTVPGGKGKKSKKKTRKDAPVDREARQGGKKYRTRDIEEREARLAAARGEKLSKKPSRRIGGGKKSSEKKVERPEKATISEPIIVKELSSALAVKVSEIIGKLMAQGVMATANQTIATDVAELIALEFGTELTVERKKSLEQGIAEEFDGRERANLKKRIPIVTMLGHVDHGKTSLLDKIRSSSVASGEAGGITQHTSAYQVVIEGKTVSFLDTPGHAAFTAMRARGANMTDIVILVVAADDGVMPQTAEAIRHAQAAEVPIIVALNKIDLQGVDVNKIYGQLAEHGLVPSEWGGDTEVIKTSAMTGQGIDELIDAIDIIAELHEFKADPTVPATGWVVEAKMTNTKGVVATLLIKEGCLKKGDVLFAGVGHGRVRIMKDCYGKSIRKATSSQPVEIAGLTGVPSAGDRFYCLKDINRAKNAAEENAANTREKSLAQRQNITLDNLFSQIEAGNVKELNLIVRADVQGSVDVLVKYLTDLSNDEIKVKILHAAVGGITEGDVVLAEASGAIIIGFNVVPEDQVKTLADNKGVDVRLYNIIYRITEDLTDAMAGMLEPVEEEKHLGKLVVRNTFKVTGVGTVAGCSVTNGIVTKNAKIRLIRNNIVIKDNGSIDSLKHFKDDVREVKSGFECGVKIVGYDDIKIDDTIEAYEIVQVARTLK